MTHPAQNPFLSIDDYLTGEDGSEIRHEYLDGQIYAMTGASDRHGLITLNIASFLRPLLRSTHCQLFASDMKVRLRVNQQELVYYPDLLLSCDPTDRETYFRRAPCLLVEVLSDSTARIDQREKLFAYQTIPSLQDYLIVSQTQRVLQIHRRLRDWTPEHITEGGVWLDCIQVELALDVIYEDVPV